MQARGQSRGTSTPTRGTCTKGLGPKLARDRRGPEPACRPPPAPRRGRRRRTGSVRRRCRHAGRPRTRRGAGRHPPRARRSHVRAPRRRRRPPRQRTKRRTVSDAPDQADRRLRPFDRRRPITARPPRVRMRSRKPCFFFRFRLFGWNVLFTHGLLERPGRRRAPGRRRPAASWLCLAPSATDGHGSVRRARRLQQSGAGVVRRVGERSTGPRKRGLRSCGCLPTRAFVALSTALLSSATPATRPAPGAGNFPTGPPGHMADKWETGWHRRGRSPHVWIRLWTTGGRQTWALQQRTISGPRSPPPCARSSPRRRGTPGSRVSMRSTSPRTPSCSVSPVR